MYISKNSEPAFSWKVDSCLDAKYGFICEKTNRNSSQLGIVESKKVLKYTSAWKQLIQKALRKTELNIVKGFFWLENFIAKIRVDKETKE